MRGLLFLLLVVAIAPLIVLVVGLHIVWYYGEMADEREANLELSHALALTFGGYVDDVSRQESAIGRALVALTPYTAEQANQYLTENAAEYMAVTGFCWTNPQGEVIASSNSGTIGLKIGDRPYFQEILRGAPLAVSNLLKERATGQLTFIIARGIRDAQGTLKGVVFAPVEPGELGRRVLNLPRLQRGMITVFDPEGTLVLVQPEAKLTLEQRRWKDKDPLLAVALAGKDSAGSLVSPIGGNLRIGARVPVAGLGWVVGASRPATEVSAPLLRQLALNLAIIAGVVAVSAGLALLISRRISHPVRDLRQAAMAVGRGDLDGQVDVRGVAELVELGEAFNRMAAGLKAAREDREKAQAALEEVNAHLEQRTAELETSNRQLQEEIAERKRVAEDLARSNKDLEQFAYVASHDLQEPLRIVSGYLQLIERRYKGKLAAEADEFITFAVDGAARMQSLIEDLLAYSRVGTQGRRFAPTDCEKVFERAVGNLGRAVADSGATVTHDPLPTVLADVTQLVQVFQNLIGNAIKFRGAEPPRIHVAARSQDGQWLFSVQDNGMGVEPQYAQRIFVLFQRLHPRDKYPGTGIGLSVCQRIIERHGGRIWVESKPGEGSTFHFTLSQTRSDNGGTGMGQRQPD
jgi:signal transduction histidine kinase